MEALGASLALKWPFNEMMELDKQCYRESGMSSSGGGNRGSPNGLGGIRGGNGGGGIGGGGDGGIGGTANMSIMGGRSGGDMGSPSGTGRAAGRSSPAPRQRAGCTGSRHLPARRSEVRSEAALPRHWASGRPLIACSATARRLHR